MDCLVFPVTILRRKYAGSWLGYRRLEEEEEEEGGCGELDGVEAVAGPVTVVVGKEKREFLVDPFVLEENPFRVLIDQSYKNNIEGKRKEKRVILVGVDSILFEHMLWLMYNDCSSFFQLNVREIIDFYSDDQD